MKIIIAPAKKMKIDTDTLAPAGLPVFLDRTKELLGFLKSLTPAQLQELWNCNEKIADQNLDRLRDMDLSRNLTPAVLSYDGIAYQYMAPQVFEEGQFDYVQENLRILSGFYGVLKPMDGVVPYRLEMQAKTDRFGFTNLYGFWGDALARDILDQSRTIINLASKEYSKCIEKYLEPGDRFITCVFGERSGKKIVQKGVYAKMCRGEMVRQMAVNRIEDPEELKKLTILDHVFSEEDSDEKTYVFIRK